MPPPLNARPGFAKDRASVIFVDRMAPKEAFTEAVSDFAKSPRVPRILTFYGVGGQGKTALCQELLRMCFAGPVGGVELKVAHIDLAARRLQGEVHAYVMLRNALATALNAKFPCFDLAYADYMEQASPEQARAVLGATKLGGLRGDVSESAADVSASVAEQAMEGVAGSVGEIVSDFAGGVPFLGPVLKRTTKWLISKGYTGLLRNNSRALQSLYGRPHVPTWREIETELPDILAHELSIHLRAHKTQRLVVFIDEYENALPSGGSGRISEAENRGSWDRGLRQFFQAASVGRHVSEKDDYAYEAGHLLVLLGRERLRWDELDSGWRSDLEGRQHLLEGLDDSDADDFLIQSGVESEELRLAMVDASRAFDPATLREAVYPIMLDLSAQIYADLLAQGRDPSRADFAVDGENYARKRAQLLARFMKQYGEGVPAILRRLACTREFDRELVRHLAKVHAQQFNMDQFESLTRLSFIIEANDGQGWSIHQHISDTLLESLDPIEQRATHLTLASWYLERARPPSSRLMNLQHAEALGDARVQAALANAPDPVPDAVLSQLLKWPSAFPLLLASGREALSIRRANNSEWLELAESNTFLGMVLLRSGALDEAQHHFEAALSLSRGRGSAGELPAAAALRGVAWVHLMRGDYGAARPLFEKVLETRRTLLEASDILVGASCYDLAGCLMAINNLEEACRLFTESLTIDRAALAPDDPDIATSLSNLADCYSALCDFDQAEPLWREALGIQERSLPADHPRTADTLASLGGLAESQANYELAREYHDRALAIRQRAYLEGHSAVAWSLCSQAHLEMRNQRYSEAEVLYGRALSILESALPADHPSIAIAIDSIATLYEKINRSDLAREYYERAHAIRVRKLPEGHPEIAASLVSLAGIYTDGGNHDEARQLYQKALEIAEKAFPPNHPEVALKIELIALVDHRTGDLAAARAGYERAIAIYEKAYGAGHPASANAVGNLAILSFSEGKPELAHELFELAASRLRASYPAGHPEIERFAKSAEYAAAWADRKVREGDDRATNLLTPTVATQASVQIAWADLPADRLSPVMALLGANGFHLPQTDDPKVRFAQLAFYPDLKFYELEYEAERRVAYVLIDETREGPDSWYALDLSNAPIYSANARYLKLNPDNVCRYVAFFFSAVRGPHGLMPVIEELGGVDDGLKSMLEDISLEDISGVLPPRFLEEGANDFTIGAALLFQGAIVKVKVKISRQGFVNIIEHDLIFEPGPGDDEGGSTD